MKKWLESAFGYVDPISAAVVEASADLAREMAPKPRLATVRQAPSRDEFDAWRDEPITQFVMAALIRNAEECREAWMDASWHGGNADQRSLDTYKARADALLGFTADYAAFVETLGLEPQA